MGIFRVCVVNGIEGGWNRIQVAKLQKMVVGYQSKVRILIIENKFRKLFFD